MKPVVVVGNGPVGQTTALLLAKWGVPSIVLDRRAARDLVGSKAICQQRDVLDVWESVGVRVAGEGLTWRQARTFYQGEQLFLDQLPDPGRSPLPPFVNLSQSRTEELLDAAIARDAALIDVRWDHQVDTITQDADGVTVAGPGFTLRAPYVVLAAGSRADALREQLGVRFDGHSFDDRFLICDIRAELPGWTGERRFYFDPVWNPGRQVLIHPCPDSSYRIDWQVPADYDLAAEIASGALDRRVRAIIGDTPYEVLWQSVYRFHSRCADRLRVGRVLLAGDAAHLYAPFGARGLNSGVADAENAAWKIAFGGTETLLESYHVERHAAATENLAITTATMDFLVPHSPAAAARRVDLLERARSGSAEARTQVDSGRLAEPYWYHDSPLTTPDPARPPTGRPAKGSTPPPGPGVLLPDLPLADGRRLRELCRDGLLVLAAPGAAPAPDTQEMTASSPELPGVLGARGGEWWVIRPDAYVAAVVTDQAALRTALARALGGTKRKEDKNGLLPTAW